MCGVEPHRPGTLPQSRARRSVPLGFASSSRVVGHFASPVSISILTPAVDGRAAAGGGESVVVWA